MLFLRCFFLVLRKGPFVCHEHPAVCIVQLLQKRPAMTRLGSRSCRRKRPLLPVHIQWAVRQSEPLPEEIRALLAILRVLLTPRPDERIKTSADIAALLMVLMGLLDYEEMWEVVRRFGVCEIAPQEQKVESS